MAEKRTIATVLATVPYTGWHIDKLRDAFAPAKLIQVDKNDADQFLRWNLDNQDELPVASGLYIALNEAF